MTERDPRDRIEEFARSGARRLDLTGFRDFILRGNVIDLAIGIVIGTAFTALVKSMVDDFLTPLVGIPLDRAQDFSDRYWTVGGSHFKYGDFVNSVIAFVLMGVALYYLVVRPMNSLMDRFNLTKGATTKVCPECKSAIPLDATRCAFCTVVLAPPPPDSEHAHPA
ncbi:MAG: large conductance mechanosensitive channel protein MscL [Frankiaceae bacterium]|nr:large conductance mechanosensitive channel protein MscL [Frankiaceae bacterium]MBV9870158.1 large conductance mechanosensitive channel protein MscL [Frankiaceae bacterium]